MSRSVSRPREEGEEAENFSDVRSVALEGGEEVLVEVDTKAPDRMEERVATEGVRHVPEQPAEDIGPMHARHSIPIAETSARFFYDGL
jgi:hypothetical protein